MTLLKMNKYSAKQLREIRVIATKKTKTKIDIELKARGLSKKPKSRQKKARRK
jgi:hypothetical protein